MSQPHLETGAAFFFNPSTGRFSLLRITTCKSNKTRLKFKMLDDMPPSQILIPPAGFTPPAEATSGKSFDVVARVSFQNGELIVESINGEPLGETMPLEEEMVEETAVAEAPADLSAAMRASGLPV